MLYIDNKSMTRIITWRNEVVKYWMHRRIIFTFIKQAYCGHRKPKHHRRSKARLC